LKAVASEKFMECLKSHNSVNFIASETINEAKSSNAVSGFPKCTTNKQMINTGLLKVPLTSRTGHLLVSNYAEVCTRIRSQYRYLPPITVTCT
jgi:hypothetical protein